MVNSQKQQIKVTNQTTVASKISKDIKPILQAVAKASENGTISNLLHTFIDAILRFLANPTTCDNFTKGLLSMLGKFDYEKNHFSLSQTDIKDIGEYHITDVCLYVNRVSKAKHNNKPAKVPLFVRFDVDGETKQTYNIDYILRFLLHTIHPDILQALDDIRYEHKLTTLANTLKFVICTTQDKLYDMADDIREKFAKYSATEELTEEHKTKERHYNNISTLETKDDLMAGGYSNKEVHEFGKRLHTDTELCLNGFDIDTDDLNNGIDVDELNNGIDVNDLNNGIDVDELNNGIDTDDLNNGIDIENI